MMACPVGECLLPAGFTAMRPERYRQALEVARPGTELQPGAPQVRVTQQGGSGDGVLRYSVGEMSKE